MADEKTKKFANLHYPGMAADPNEGRIAVSPQAAWRFQEQIKCIGEDAQKKLLRCSAFVLSSNPLGARVVKKLFAVGFGRVGAFGDQALEGAADLAQSGPEDKQGVLPALSRWAKAEAPWATFEPFRETSIDRQLGDMVRGFDYVISCSDPATAGNALVLARENGLPVVAASITGRSGWCAFMPSGSICEDCLEVPELAPEQGFYFPLLELVATWVATAAVEYALDPQSRVAFIETFDATRSPWMRETRELKPKAGCGKCSART